MQENERSFKQATVVIVDDHPSYAEGIGALIETVADEIRVVGSAHNAESGVALVDEMQPDLVLLDVHMPHREGVEAAKKITAQHPGVKVVMLTGSEAVEDITECVRAGVSGYLSKTMETAELVSSLRTIVNGEAVFGNFVMPALLKNHVPDPELDDQDIAVLRLLAQGLDRAAVAREIAISESSLKRLMRDIERKLGVHNRIQAVAVAAKKGLI